MSNDWIKWNGGERSVDASTIVDVSFGVISEGPKPARPDMVNSPPHYTDGGIEAIDYIKAKLGPDGFKVYCVSKAIWYLRRAAGE